MTQPLTPPSTADTAAIGTAPALARFQPAPRADEALTLADVGGMAALKAQARRKIIEPFLRPELFARYGQKSGGGMLLYGPPGCGKTWFARALAGECGAAFFSVGIHEILDMWLGNSERNLHALFEAARAHRPAIVFIDELDALGRRRDLLRHSSLPTLINTFLAELDGLGADNRQLLVLGATNAPWDVDPAFRRPGRFDQGIFVPPPDEAARQAILALHLRSRPTAPGLDLAEVVRCTDRFSGADLAAVVEQATFAVLDEVLAGGPERPIAQPDLLRVARALKPSTAEWLQLAEQHLGYGPDGVLCEALKSYLERTAPRRIAGFVRW